METLLKIIFIFLTLIIASLLSVLFVTLLERKILGLTNNRKAPNIFLLNSLFQSLIDFVKLIQKKISKINFIIKKYWLIIIFYGLIILILLNLNYPLDNRNLFIYTNFIYFFLIYSLISFFFLILSYSSNRIYSILALYRCIVQIVRYEVGLVLIFLLPIIYINVYNFYIYYLNRNEILIYSIIYIYLLVLIGLREINRTPYDFLECESELVSGFNVEYLSSLFSFIFLIEYGFFVYFTLLINLIYLTNILYILFILIFLILRRAILPRYRYDKILYYFWKDLIYMLFILFIYFIIL